MTNWIKRVWSWTKRQWQLVIGTLLIPVAFAATQLGNQPVTLLTDSPAATRIPWLVPTSDEQWAEDVKKEQLHTRRDDQLAQMEQDLSTKLPELEEIVAKHAKYPQVFQYETEQQLIANGYSGQALSNELSKQMSEYQARIQWEVDKVKQSLDRVHKEQELRRTGKVDRRGDIK